MNKNAISYCLFGDKIRYWNLIPSIIIFNKIVHPDIDLILYAHEEIKDNELFPVIDFAVSNNLIDIRFINVEYQKTYLTNWRLKPLWDDIDLLFCRDIDALPTPFEARTIRYFIENDQYALYSMRAHPLHTIPLMAGLCGFRKSRIAHFLGPDFNSYLEFGRKNCSYCKDWRWGCDQQLLCKFFIDIRGRRFQNKYLEICVPNKIGRVKPLSTNKVKSTCINFQEINEIKLDKEIDRRLLQIFEGNYGKFIGQSLIPQWGVPMKTVQNFNKRVLDLPILYTDEYKKFIYNNITLRKFYIGK